LAEFVLVENLERTTDRNRFWRWWRGPGSGWATRCSMGWQW